MQKMTLIPAIRKFLVLPAENFSDIRDQYQRLTAKDKDDLAAWFPLADPPVEIVPAETK
jgi:hypothetical protein